MSGPLLAAAFVGFIHVLSLVESFDASQPKVSHDATWHKSLLLVNYYS